MIYKAIFVTCGLFVYLFAPPGMIPEIPGGSQTVLAVSLGIVVAPSLLSAFR